MINMPIEKIKEKISEKAKLSEEEIDNKIKEKLKQLSGLISQEGAAHIVANELGVKLFETGGLQKIKDILSGMRNVDLVAKVVQKYELREFESSRGPGKVANLLVGDETGVMRLVMWNKQAENLAKLSEGDVVKVQSGYSRDNNGRVEVHLNDMSKVAINPEGVSVEVKQRTQAPVEAVRKSIADINENDNSVEVLATIVQVFDINFFEACPECNRRVRKKDEGFVCNTHGLVEPAYNFVLNAYLDDGSDNVRVVFWSDQTLQLLEKKKEEILAFRQNPAPFEEVKNDLLGKMVKITGRANKNQNFDRIELVATNVDLNPDPKEETERLKESTPEKASEPAKEEKPSEPVKEEPESKPKTESEPEKKQSDDDDIGDLEDVDLDAEMMDIEDI
jgi:replication factor A1